ncbi:MAG: MBOAT family protein, partial [Candidatus Pacebacteria bacterium]|nr:MBOAT family protein [Candidatus Paceibacterota bacterium]
MLFCSESFLIFFTIVFTLYWALRSNSLRVWLLLIASFLFYATWNKWLAVVIALSTLMDFVVGIVMESSGSPLRRKLVLALSLTGNLGLLVYFKYMKFFIESIQSPLYALGFDNVFPVMQVILPIGISFYTFEAINYTVDVYRRRIPAERRLTHFMLFITFFPHLVAGPIVRARDFLPQVARMKRWDWARIQLGAQFFAGGLFKKMAIADRMALFADPVFASPSQFGSYAVWIGTLAYTVQIYCDFSGYT